MGHTTMRQGRENLKKIRKEKSDKRDEALKKSAALRAKELVAKKVAKTITDDETKELTKLQGKK